LGEDGWLGLNLPGLRGIHVANRRTSSFLSGRMHVMNCAADAEWVKTSAPRVAVRDCIVSARVEFVGDEAGGWGSGVALRVRERDQMAYSATVRRRGGASLILRSRQRGYWGTDEVADGREFRTPDGVLHLTAVAQGKRFELYCNGQLVLSSDELRLEPGSVGIEATRAHLIIHDFKWRPLPSDPLHGKLYRQRAP
jgi:hypothetical protein